jgi:hypothetical protein
LNGNVLTYKQAADKLGAHPDTLRRDAKGYPVIKNGKEHLIPYCVFRMMVRDKLVLVR